MVTVEPDDEMSKFVLLSLHGIPPPPAREMHAHKRADAWYGACILLLIFADVTHLNLDLLDT